MNNIATKFDGTFFLPLDIYPLESIQLAACGFLDEGFFYLFQPENKDDKGQIGVAIKARDLKRTSPDVLFGKFLNELNRQSLRIALNKMNRKVRTQIIGRALTSAIPVEADMVEEEAAPANIGEDTTG